MNQRDELQKLLDRLNQKILHLRTTRVTTIDPGAIVTIDIQVEEHIGERDKVKQEIEDLDKALAQELQEQVTAQQINILNQASTSEQLYRALLKLDYQTQAISFRQFIEFIGKKSAAAFLLHGSSPKYGQRWLLNRLVRKHVSDMINDKVVRFHLGRVAHSNDISALWRELADRVGLKREPSVPSSLVAERVCQWLQTQNVILVFNDVDQMPKAFLPELLQNFWLPLVRSKTQNFQSQTNKFQLLMFLIDNQGCVCDWDFTFAKKFEPTWKPDVPIILPIINKFSEEILSSWLGNEVDTLPLELTEENTVENILENSDSGVPELALDEICILCGCDWYEEQQKWLKL